jgi:hypothetical protein
MQLRYIVDVTLDPTSLEEGLPERVVRDEIASNLEGLKYVHGCYVAVRNVLIAAPCGVRRSTVWEQVVFKRVRNVGKGTALYVYMNAMDRCRWRCAAAAPSHRARSPVAPTQRDSFA